MGAPIVANQIIEAHWTFPLRQIGFEITVPKLLTALFLLINYQISHLFFHVVNVQTIY